MSDYVLVYSGGKMPETEAEQAAVMGAWTTWLTSLGSAVKDQGNPFSPAAKRIATDGAVSDIAPGSGATGYSIIEADSLDEAVTKSKDCPALSGGGDVSVYETFEVM
jgi:hypothetical protein